MKDGSSKNVSQIRHQHNQDLIRKMRNGESLTSFDSKASWYPPRPTIKKDPREMARVYYTAEQYDFTKAGAPNDADPAHTLRVITPD